MLLSIPNYDYLYKKLLYNTFYLDNITLWLYYATYEN